MLLGTVIGNVWATKKLESLTGQAFLLVRPEGAAGGFLICADRVGAGAGDQVLVACGSAARIAVGAEIPLDAAIVGIVDRVEER